MKYLSVFAFTYHSYCFDFITALASSSILSGLDGDQYPEVLLSYLSPVLMDPGRSVFVRCWHAKADGWAAATFHNNCDGKGPTVTIIQVNSYIFGGYTNVSWHSKYEEDNNNNFICTQHKKH